MQSTSAAPLARWGPLAMALVVLGLWVMPAPAHAGRSHRNEPVAMPSAGWHGRAIQKPRPRPRLVRTSWPQGWAAGAVGLGSGYGCPDGSQRVREVQRRLRQLGYRPGPVDGLFGPRTRAATRWFQFKHGLAVTGRVNRATLVVLRARSDHKPLPTAKPQGRNPRTKAVAPLGTPKRGPAAADHARAASDDAQPAGGDGRAASDDAQAAARDARATSDDAQAAAGDGRPTDRDGRAAGGDDLSVPWPLAGLLLIVAVILGVLTSLAALELRRLWKTEESPPAPPAPALPEPQTTPEPAPRRRPRSLVRAAPRVLGYATVDGERDDPDTATAALALRCAHRGWSLVEVIHDRRDAGRSITERPGLMYAVDALRSRAANGLVVARLRDFTSRIADLATLLKWLAEADAFLGAADHELDTSTRAGRGTAGAIIELGHWERQRISERTRADLVRGRFVPAAGPTAADLARQIAAMQNRGLSLRAIADALNIAGIPGPLGQPRWHPTDVKALKEAKS